MTTGIEVAGIALASMGAAQQLFDCGLRVYRRIKKEKQLNLLLRELQMFEVDDNRQMLNNYVRAVQPVLRSQLIEPEDKDRLLRRWERIKKYLIHVDELIDTMIENSSIFDTQTRHEARNDLRDMGSTKVLSGLLMDFRDDASLLQKQLNSDPPTFLSGKDFIYIDVGSRVVPRPDMLMGKGRLTKTKDGSPSQVQWFLVESKAFREDDDKDMIKEDVAILTRKLARTQTNRGIFQLLGFREELKPNNRAFELVFGGMFDGKFPFNLSTYMQTHPTKPSLNFRVNLCCQLATAVLETQTLGLVHKNIRPENLLVLEATRSPLASRDEAIPALNLCGWQYARYVGEGYITRLTNEVTLQRKVYQHPERQLPTSDHDYSMAHDVYSLGVCMLEILRWKSILQPGQGPEQPASVSEDFIEAFKTLKFAPNEADAVDRYTKFPRQIKAVLLRINETYVPAEAGSKMCYINHGFLTCLDKDKNLGPNDDDAGEYVLTGESERREQAMKFMDTALKDLQTVLRTI